MLPTSIGLPSTAPDAPVDPAIVDEVVARYRQDRYVFLENVFERTYIEKVQEAYFARYVCADYEARVLNVGDKRCMINVAFELPFDVPHLYGYPFLLAVLHKLTGPERSSTALARFSPCRAPTSKPSTGITRRCSRKKKPSTPSCRPLRSQW